MIIVKPTGGLANRLRVLNSSLILANLNKVNLIYVIWDNNSDLNASFDNIFTPVVNFRFINSSFLYNLFLKPTTLKNKKKGERLFLKLIRKCVSYYKVYDNLKVYSHRFDSNFWSKNHKNVIIDTCYDFFLLKDGNYYSKFVLLPFLQNRVESIKSKLKSNCFGLHIRRSDNIKSIQFSTVDLFIYIINFIISNNSNVSFYLSTDDSDLLCMLNIKYPNYIISQKRSNYRRDTQDGVIEAALDMYVLSNISTIFGSFWSSFSEVSSWINNSNLIIVDDNVVEILKKLQSKI
jgi:hypothetical protein